MAITRKLLEIKITFDAAGAVTVDSTYLATDDVEGTATGVNKKFNANRVVTAAQALRDEVVSQFAGQDKPVTF